MCGWCGNWRWKLSPAIFWSLKSLWGRLIKLFVDCKLYLWHLADNDKYIPSQSKPTHSSLPPQAGTNINQGQGDKCKFQSSSATKVQNFLTLGLGLKSGLHIFVVIFSFKSIFIYHSKYFLWMSTQLLFMWGRGVCLLCRCVLHLSEDDSLKN